MESIKKGHSIADGCSREDSRIARKLIHSEILSVAGVEAAQLPLDCPLNPVQDLFKLQEDAKMSQRGGNFRCAFCGKVFRNEMYMDRHMENKHPEAFAENSTLCLADFCDVLHCDEAVGRIGSDAPCRDDEMERRQFRCRAVFDRCFPHDGRHGAAMHDVFVHDFCDTITCGRPGEAGRGTAGRATLSGAVAGPTAEPAAKTGSVGATMTILLLLVLGVWYGTMAFQRFETATRRDLRPLRSRQRKGGLGALLDGAAAVAGSCWARLGLAGGGGGGARRKRLD